MCDYSLDLVASRSRGASNVNPRSRPSEAAEPRPDLGVGDATAPILDSTNATDADDGPPRPISVVTQSATAPCTRLSLPVAYGLQRTVAQRSRDRHRCR